MPQWITLLVLAIVAWLVLSVGGGLIIGRLLAVASRRRRIV
jgi:nitrate reductase NapE component